MDQFLHGGSCGQIGQLVCEHQNLIRKHWRKVFLSLITVVTCQIRISSGAMGSQAKCLAVASARVKIKTQTIDSRIVLCLL